LIVYPGFVSDYYAKRNDTLNISFRIKPEAETGNLLLFIPSPDSTKNSDRKYIVELLNEKGLVHSSLKTTLPIQQSFDLLEPGNYSLRVIDDRNNNAYWDTGIMTTKQQPERVYLCTKSFTVKASWDIEEKVVFLKRVP